MVLVLVLVEAEAGVVELDLQAEVELVMARSETLAVVARAAVERGACVEHMDPLRPRLLEALLSQDRRTRVVRKRIWQLWSLGLMSLTKLGETRWSRYWLREHLTSRQPVAKRH